MGPLPGYPALNTMVYDARENEEKYQRHYHQRPMVEGVNSALREKYGVSVLSKIRRNKNIEVLCRVVAWKIFASV